MKSRSCSRANRSSWGRRAMEPSGLRISQMTPAGSNPARRAKSTEASVCPTRRNTPPGTARNGKMWPGRRRSSGRLVGSISTLMVVARSKALMPVVTPYLRCASTDTVKSVCCGSVLSSVMGGRPSSPARSRVRATQMRPRACLVMKLTTSGVAAAAAHTRSPSFSRSSSSATMTILPARMARMAASTRECGTGLSLAGNRGCELTGAYPRTSRSGPPPR